MDKHSRCHAACQRGRQGARWCLLFPFPTLFSSSTTPRQGTTSACIYRRFLRSVSTQSSDLFGTQLRKQGAASASGLHRGQSIFVDARLCTLPQSAEVLHADSTCLPTCQSAWLVACRHPVVLCPRTISLATLPGALTYNTINILLQTTPDARTGCRQAGTQAGRTEVWGAGDLADRQAGEHAGR